jgi:hypothetical protein
MPSMQIPGLLPQPVPQPAPQAPPSPAQGMFGGGGGMHPMLRQLLMRGMQGQGGPRNPFGGGMPQMPGQMPQAPQAPRGGPQQQPTMPPQMGGFNPGSLAPTGRNPYGGR